MTRTKLFYPSVSNVGSFNPDGIQKEKQEISFIKQNKKGEKGEKKKSTTATSYIPALSATLARVNPKPSSRVFTALSPRFKISLDLKGGEAEAARGIAGQLKAHYSLCPAPR